MIHSKLLRILRTCNKQGCDAILIEGTTGYLRRLQGLQGFDVPVQELGEIAMWVSSLKSEVPATLMAGLEVMDVQYEGIFPFRIASFGHPPQAMTITRMTAPVVPVPPMPDGPAGSPLSLAALFNQVEIHDARDLLLSPGCAPAIWTADGHTVFFGPPLTKGDLKRLLPQIPSALAEASEADHQERGYLSFSFEFTKQHLLLAAVFGEEEPFFVMLMRVPREGNGPVVSATSNDII